MTPPRPLRQVLEELALHNRTHLRDPVTARLLTELSSLDREEPARVATLEAALRSAYHELWQTYGDTPRTRSLFDKMDAALTVSASSGREQG